MTKLGAGHSEVHPPFIIASEAWQYLVTLDFGKGEIASGTDISSQ